MVSLSVSPDLIQMAGADGNTCEQPLEAEGAAVTDRLPPRHLLDATFLIRRKNPRSFHFSARFRMSLRRDRAFGCYDGICEEDTCCAACD